MTEYIAKCRELVGITGKTFQFPEYIDQTEEIVRCRECAYYYEADNYHPSGNYTSRCCKYFDSYMNEVQPDGFCAWGERREAGE